MSIDELFSSLSIQNKLVFVDVLVDEKEHVYPMHIRQGAIDDMWVEQGVKA